MADIIRGTNIADPIVPYTTADNIPTHYAKYGKGGFRTVENIVERDNIPLERREDGMLVYVITDETNVHTYQWFSVEGNPEGEWKRSKMGGGDSIPLYDSAKLEELGDAAESDYIFIPSDSDMEGEVTENTYITTKNGSYVDILFGAIRRLQSEVARLRNAFNYGIYSYSGTDTAMSRVQGIYEGDIDEEPLWAIDEDGLSLQEDLIGNIIDFYPQNNINHTLEGLPLFVGTTTWEDSVQNIISGVDDSKLFLYLTSNSLDILIRLKNKDDELIPELELDLTSILSDIPQLDWYNILLVVSRKQKIEKEGEDPVYFGSNFIWFSVSNPKTNNTVVEGYLDVNNQDIVKTAVVRSSRFTIDSIVFGPLRLSKAIIYSKYQDFSHEVIPSKPTDSDFSYKAAHITIRSVSSYNILSSIKDQLPENELIFVEDTKKLYIKNNYKLVAISGAGNDEIEPPEGEDTMTDKEILQILAEKGIIYYDYETNKYTGLQPLSGITLINEDTGKQFEINVDAYGKLVVNEVSDEDTLEDRLNRLPDFPPSEEATWTNWRGFVGRLRMKEERISIENASVKLCSDRIKIGSFYAPARTQLTFGCSHGFIELENTSDRDFQLDGCYLHYARKVGGDFYTSHLALSGKIPKGGTYLIRCKQYSDLNDPNTFIKIENYDIEWYDKDVTALDAAGEEVDVDTSLLEDLVDLSHNGIVDEDPHGLALTYGKTFGSYGEVFTHKCQVWTSATNLPSGVSAEKVKFFWWPRFIDAVYYNSYFKNSANKAYWAAANNRMASCIFGADDKNTTPEAKVFIDAIYKNTFELDPAQQAYQALNTYDSSRYRNANVADYQYILLNNEYISFPKTEEIYPVNKFTPKASFEKKNVLTDKNKLDPNKPNCVTCSFGINPYTTRTFNWVSSGYFDEYIWVREKNSTEWNRFESYTKKEEGASVVQDSNYPRRREFSAEINNIIYNRIYGYFPGDKNCTYTSHKCILDITETSVNSKTTYEYVVGRSLASGDPDPEHSSNIMTFTLYPEDYLLKIYQTTDQQGFHWVEYQAWGAAANYINDQIKEECEGEEIIPILMNTGDMTQSGSRVNEWVDYYNAGKLLFNHLEQVNCVGNNDLCGTIVTDLGTGDDIGKSNSFYFHVFYCYEVDTEEKTTPIINGKYIPSLYHIDFKDFRIVMVNSEITSENCKSWYRMVVNREGMLLNNSAFSSEDFNGKIDNGEYSVVNIYTGWTIGTGTPIYVNGFTTIYTILYNILTSTGGRKCVVACHEMPFTVITHENLTSNSVNASRSVSKTSLVGSHLNQIDVSDSASIYWFSRLLESTGVKLCLGGHKHTYSQTWPVREHYYYKDANDNWVSSLDNGPMTMTETLSEERDCVKWILRQGDSSISTVGTNKVANPENPEEQILVPQVITPTDQLPVHLSKFPIIANYGGVIYFMCQATGFKLMSNKELPSTEQVFSQFLPMSNVDESKASTEQRRPMYAVIDLEKEKMFLRLILMNLLLQKQNHLICKKQRKIGKNRVVHFV